MFKYKNGLSMKIVHLLSEIDIFKGKWLFLKNIEPDRLKELRRTTIVTSSGASTRIEGAELSDQEIEARLSGLKIDKISITETYTPIEEAILTLLKTESKVTNEMIRNKFDFNQNTIKNAFQKLVKKN